MAAGLRALVHGVAGVVLGRTGGHGVGAGVDRRSAGFAVPGRGIGARIGKARTMTHQAEALIRSQLRDGVAADGDGLGGQGRAA